MKEVLHQLAQLYLTAILYKISLVKCSHPVAQPPLCLTFLETHLLQSQMENLKSSAVSVLPPSHTSSFAPMPIHTHSPSMTWEQVDT